MNTYPKTPQARRELVQTALSALKAAEAPNSPRARRLIRDALVRNFGCSLSTAQRAVRDAALLLDGQPRPQWGGHRPDAGRPRKITDSETS